MKVISNTEIAEDEGATSIPQNIILYIFLLFITKFQLTHNSKKNLKKSGNIPKLFLKSLEVCHVEYFKNTYKENS